MPIDVGGQKLQDIAWNFIFLPVMGEKKYRVGEIGNIFTGSVGGRETEVLFYPITGKK